ncbi:phosphoenolpyruvate-utilizing N-terminal domain-containing protein, partial [Algiphilus sp.]
MSLWLHGIGVARGIAIGRVVKISGTDIEIREYTVGADEIDAEIARYETAHERAKQQLRDVRAQIPAGTPQDIAAFIDTHLLMLDDSSLSEAVIGRIRDERLNAEGALRRARDALIAVFEQMDDPYLRTRQNDVEHVVARVLRNLVQSERAAPENAPEVDAEEARIVVADDITPADIILL